MLLKGGGGGGGGGVVTPSGFYLFKLPDDFEMDNEQTFPEKRLLIKLNKANTTQTIK